MRYRLTLIVTLSLFSALAALSVTAHAVGRDERLNGLFGAACGEPCFLDVRLYDTSMMQVREVLDTSPFVTEIDERARMDFIGNEHLFFRWRWRDGRVSDGTFAANHGTVYSTWLSGDLPFGDLWRALGHPEIFTYTISGTQRGDALIYATLFDDASARLAIRLECPLTPSNLVRANVLNVEFRRADLALVNGAPPIDTLNAWLLALRRNSPC